MPAAGWLAAHIVYPICGDYVYSVTIVSAVIITLLIIVMCICLQKLLVVRCHLTISAASACEILFLTLFFLIFRNHGTSQCMFSAADLCCIYCYTMSGLLNAIVVLIFLQFDNITEAFLSWKHIQKLLFLILLYFALFSHLFHSALTAIYAGVYLLINLRRYKHNYKQYIGKNIICLLVLVMWGIALFFEANGGRADVIGADMTLDFALAIRQLIALICVLSKPFVIVLIILLAAIMFHMFTGRLRQQSEIVRIFAIIVCNESLLTIFLLLLNAKCAYMSRIDASWGMWFYLITMIVVAIAYLIKNIPFISRALPVMLLLFIFAAAYPDGKFLMSTREHTDYQTCVQLGQYVVDSIIEAEQSGAAEITIRIPDHSDDLRSLTYNEELGDKVANCLYVQGIITSKTNVRTVVDKNMNDIMENNTGEH